MKDLLALFGLTATPAAASEADAPRRLITRRRLARDQYTLPPSFTDLLPWCEYLPDHQAFLLEDGRSVGIVLEITPVGCEARPPSFMGELHQGLLGMLSNVLEIDPSPWVVQVYVQDETDLRTTSAALRDYVRADLRDSTLTRHWLAVMDAHLSATSRPGGVFHDSVVTNWRWGGKLRRTRLVVYRRFRREEQPLRDSLEQLRDQVGRLRASLDAAGVSSRVADGAHVYDWLLQWFNPRPGICDGYSTRLADIAPYPGDRDLPFGRDFAELLTLSVPQSDTEANLWRLDGMPHTLVSVQGLRRAPEIGALTAERSVGNQVYAVFDRLPAGTVMAMTLVCRPQDLLRAHVANVKRASVGDGAEAVLAHENASQVELQMARGDRLVPTYLSFYVRAEDETALRRQVNHVESLLLQNGLQTVGRESEFLACDAWLRNLPMNYDPALDRSHRRSRLMFGTHLTSLLPVYGRSRGTGHPGQLFWNRGGEPLSFDPLHKDDRKKNGHMLIVGPTGAGKSATLVYLIMQALAVWRPRVYLIEAGNSFGLMCDYLRSHALSVHSVAMQPNADVSLPPFAGALSLLETDPTLAAVDLEAVDAATPDDDDPADDLEEGRDLLGEMEIAARIMITGGDAREDARMSRADRLVIRRAILEAAGQVRATGRDQVLTEDVATALRRAGQDESLDPRRRERAVDMGDALLLFCSGVAGHFFNREGNRWPDVDVTHLDMGILQREGYEDQLTVAYIALMNHINSVVEARQHDARPTLVITDEGHIITTNPLLAPYVIKITKMWRKFGAWYWIATQNLDDFPDASRRMLSMLEWWLCLVMPKDEVEQIARFRQLTDEQRQMLLSARKESGKYTEGVVLTDNLAALFRNVPPALALALAQTEKDEKAARAEIMRRERCSEVEAAMHIAAEIESRRAGG
ncbi:MAG: conjugative transfer ATPase [Chromatiaceae bacterium]|nr:conjugative transfer ATPase [Chromatiaceae bacterium]